MKHSNQILSIEQIKARLERREHPLDAKAERQTVSMGDATGLSRVGLHYTIVKPGMTSTMHHRHHLSDEFLIVMSGEATLKLDTESHTIKAGDFIGLPALGPAHSIHNDSNADFVYIVGGDRPAFDVCEYPTLDKRVYLYFENGKRHRDFVENRHVDTK